MERVLEGTWDEIKLHEAEFAGRHLRVIVDMDQPDSQQQAIQQRLKALNEFFSYSVDNVIVDDSREAIYGHEIDRG